MVTSTWHVGKWHLGGVEHYPNKQGFEYNVGGCEVGSPPSGYFSSWHIPALVDTERGKYLTDHLTDEAVRLIQNRNRPYFLNLWHLAVHTPIQAPPALVEKYPAKARRLGLNRMQALEQGEFFPTKHKRNQHVLRRRIQSEPVYAVMIENLDTNIGRLLTTVDENTIVIFTSDNGGLATAEGSPTCNFPLAGERLDVRRRRS